MPVTATKLTEARLKVLKLIAADGRPVIPNDLAMRLTCQELCYGGLLTRQWYIIDAGGVAHHATAYSVSADGWAVLGGGK